MEVVLQQVQREQVESDFPETTLEGLDLVLYLVACLACEIGDGSLVKRSWLLVSRTCGVFISFSKYESLRNFFFFTRFVVHQLPWLRLGT